MRMKSYSECVSEYLQEYGCDLYIRSGVKLSFTIYDQCKSELVSFESLIDSGLEDIYHWFRNESKFATEIATKEALSQVKMIKMSPPTLDGDV